MSQERLHIPRNDDTKISSRLIVKNIPKYVDDARLKEHFGSHGEVTDCKVIRTRYDAGRFLIQGRMWDDSRVFSVCL